MFLSMFIIKSGWTGSVAVHVSHCGTLFLWMVWLNWCVTAAAMLPCSASLVVLIPDWLQLIRHDHLCHCFMESWRLPDCWSNWWTVSFKCEQADWHGSWVFSSLPTCHMLFWFWMLITVLTEAFCHFLRTGPSLDLIFIYFYDCTHQFSVGCINLFIWTSTCPLLPCSLSHLFLRQTTRIISRPKEGWMTPGCSNYNPAHTFHFWTVKKFLLHKLNQAVTVLQAYPVLLWTDLQTDLL